MYNYLTNPLKKRVIRELRQILYEHPRYRADSNNVQNKFSFQERPQRGIIVNNASADLVKLSADNYMGRLSSFVMLTYVAHHPGTSIEWVRENNALLDKFSVSRSIFPSPPGVYTIKITSVPNEGLGTPGTFTIDPVLTIKDEPLITFNTSAPGTAQLSNQDIYPGAVRLWLDGRRALLMGVDFVVDYPSGLVTFLKQTPAGSTIYADYRYKIAQQGPFNFQSEEFNVTAIPGAVIAFGDRVQECDQQAIVVTDDRTDVSENYGGKFEVHLSLVVFSRDAEDREKMSDYVIIKVLERQNALGYEGLELLDISPGGEEEEVYNATTDDYFYQSNVSLTLRVDWELQIALPAVVFRVEQVSKAEEDQKGYLDGMVRADLLRVGTNIGMAGKATVEGKHLGFERMR